MPPTCPATPVGKSGHQLWTKLSWNPVNESIIPLVNFLKILLSCSTIITNIKGVFKISRLMKTSDNIETVHFLNRLYRELCHFRCRSQHPVSPDLEGLPNLGDLPHLVLSFYLLNANHWHRLWEIPAITGVKSNITTFNYISRLIVNIFYCSRIIFNGFKHADIKGVGWRVTSAAFFADGHCEDVTTGVAREAGLASSTIFVF